MLLLHFPTFQFGHFASYSKLLVQKLFNAFRFVARTKTGQFRLRPENIVLKPQIKTKAVSHRGAIGECKCQNLKKWTFFKYKN